MTTTPGPFDALFVAGETRDLDRGFVRLGTGIAEEHAIHAAELAQAASKIFLLRHLVEVGGVQKRAGLFRQRAGDRRVCVAQATHGEAGQTVQIAFAVGIVQIGAVAAHECNG